jgi:hypothetical protein
MRNMAGLRPSVPRISLRVGDSWSTWKNLSLFMRGNIHYIKFMYKDVIDATLLHIILFVKFIIFRS